MTGYGNILFWLAVLFRRSVLPKSVRRHPISYQLASQNLPDTLARYNLINGNALNSSLGTYMWHFFPYAYPKPYLQRFPGALTHAETHYTSKELSLESRIRQYLAVLWGLRLA